MQVGDLVWSLSADTTDPKKRLAIIIALDYEDYNPYFIKLVACGRQGKTARKYLEPLDRD